ncbi:hypothetical protein B0I35DRAFT_418549 [Stachybotrys elegans]|uniref:Uncharacterized protein n=1 Tax=Stachybotrys elegans TaxID=80388 RepID=A0A8K0T4U3_9HYPO|nr:hypothetical protein B0I35DRAFT_418549 [Stachybotrys elegans]
MDFRACLQGYMHIHVIGCFGSACTSLPSWMGGYPPPARVHEPGGYSFPRCRAAAPMPVAESGSIMLASGRQ